MTNGTRQTEEARLSRKAIIDHLDCEDCEEQYVFLMRQGDREFTMGLRTVLACLAFAQNEHAVPDLPDDWWNRVANRYE